MKKILPLAGFIMATVGTCLMAVSCGDKNDTSTSTKEDPPAAPAKTDPPSAVPEPEEKPAAEEAAPTGDLESEAVGYWALDTEAMMKEMEEELKDSPNELAAAKAMMAPMMAAMTVHIPEKGKVVMHIMGDSHSMSYTVKSVEEATKTLTVEITDPDGETETGAIIIGEDKLRIEGGDDGLSLVRIDEAAFKKRQEAKVPNILDLPEGPGPDSSEEDPATEETAPEAPAEEDPATEEDEKPDPAPED